MSGCDMAGLLVLLPLLRFQRRYSNAITAPSNTGAETPRHQTGMVNLIGMPDEEAEWEAVKLVRRAAYRKTCLPVYGVLGASCAEQSAFLHLAGVRFAGAVHSSAEDCERQRHVGAYKQVNAFDMFRPMHALFGTTVGGRESYGPLSLSERILGSSDTFLAGTFLPRG